jgi:AraC family transcriptional regulator
VKASWRRSSRRGKTARWLPASGEEARDLPIYCQRLSFFPEVPEHETVADLFLPLK